MPKRLIFSLIVAFVVATLVSNFADQRPYKELARRTAIADEAMTPNTKCPLSRQYIDRADLDLLSICLTYGLSAFEAAQHYPGVASKVFAVYGEEEIFPEILDQYGHQVIPVIAFFVENGSLEFQVRQAFGEIVEQLWAGQMPKWDPSKLTREQIGLIAIHQIAARGHELLAEFEIVDGVAKRKQVTRVVLGAKDLFLGGATNLERVLVRGERLPTWTEAGLAALDGTIIIGGVGAFAKVARVGGRAMAEKSTARLMAEGAYETVSNVGKAGAFIAPSALLYVAVTRPALIPSLGGWLAEQFGIPRIIGIAVVYFAGILLVLKFSWPLIWFGKAVRALFRRRRHFWGQVAAA